MATSINGRVEEGFEDDDEGNSADMYRYRVASNAPEKFLRVVVFEARTRSQSCAPQNHIHVNVAGKP